MNNLACDVSGRGPVAFVAGAVIALAAVVGCGGPADTADSGADASGLCVPSADMWASRVEPDVERYCGSCHGERPQFGAPYALTDLDFLLAPRADGRRPVDLIAARVHDGQMPPRSLPRMPDETARAMVEWASCGAQTVTEQEGLTSSARPWVAPVEAPEGLETIELTADEFEVGPDVRDLYQCFVFDVPGTEDRFIRRFEMIFDRTEVLHHLVLLRDTDGTAPTEDYECIGSMPEGSQYLYAWAPGQGAVQFPDGGLRLRPGERYVMQLHYNNGAALPDVRDSSGVRLYVAPPEGEEYGMLAIGPLNFSVPARGEETVGSYCTVREASRILGGMPHMHEVGSAFREHVERAAGGRDTVVELTGWDFHSQLFYETPVSLSPGDRIYTECSFVNPRSEVVRTGPRTEDEMCFHFAYITPAPTERYCDEGNGTPTDVDYTPGACAPGASSDVPLARIPWRQGEPETLAGGPVPDGTYEITGGETLVSDVSTALGTLDLEASFSLSRGQMIVSGGEITFDVANLAHLESTSGAAIDNPFARSISGTWTPGTSPATVAQRCPDTGSASFDYESDGEQVTLRFGPLSALPGASLWTTFVVTRRP
jgi:hypothetical protein